MLVLLFVVLWFILRCDLCITLCYFVIAFFSPVSIAITSTGDERVNLSAFRTFVRFAHICFCVSFYAVCLKRTAVCECGNPCIFLLPSPTQPLTPMFFSCVCVCVCVCVCGTPRTFLFFFYKSTLYHNSLRIWRICSINDTLSTTLTEIVFSRLHIPQNEIFFYPIKVY